MRTRAFGILLGLAAFAAGLTAAPAEEAPRRPAMIEPPSLAEAVAAGPLPPVDERVPEQPEIVRFEGPEKAPGQYGGTLRMLGGSAKDTRTLVVYGYARLVGYDPDFNIVPDIAAKVDVEEGRRFTLHLRPGHRWSD